MTYYSDSKQTEIEISEMNRWWLENALKKEMRRLDGIKKTAVDKKRLREMAKWLKIKIIEVGE